MIPMLRILSLFLLILLLAACGTTDINQPAPDSLGFNAAITWDRNPDTIVFRAEIAGGGRENDFISRNDIAPCTVYGDNRVVWTNELSSTEQQVLFDQVTDDALRLFVELLTVVDRIYTFPERASLQLPSSTSPVYEQMTISVAGETFVSDSFADWPAGYFQQILERCRTISATPVLFEPTAGWLSVQGAEFDFSSPTYPWDSAASGVRLADLAVSGQRLWITDNLARVLWNLIRTSPPSLLLNEDGLAFRIALEVPRVTRYSPPAQ
jgi:hypothetical protein